MRNRWRALGYWWVLWCGLALGACGAPDETTDPFPELDSAQGAPHHPRPVDPWTTQPTAPSRVVVGWTTAGAPTLFDSTSGTLLDEGSPSPYGQTAGARDVVWDSFQNRVLLCDSDEDEQGGEISTLAVTGLASGWPRFAEPAHRAWVDGRARLWPTPRGIVVFEEGLGERWKLLRDDGVPTVSVAAARPSSIWSQSTSDGQRLVALGYGPSGSRPALQQTEALVSARQLGAVCTTPLGVAPTTVPPTARMVPWRDGTDSGPSDRAVLVDLADGRLVLRLLAPRRASRELAVPHRRRYGRIEQVLMLPGHLADHRRGLAILLSAPSSLLVASMDAAPSIVDADTLELPGIVRVQDRFFGRDALAVAPDRLLVATDSGVWAVRVDTARGSLRLERDGDFDGSLLRGPLAGPLRRRLAPTAADVHSANLDGQAADGGSG